MEHFVAMKSQSVISSIEQCINAGYFSVALKFIDSLKISEMNILDRLTCQIFQAKLLAKQTKYTESQQLIEKSENEVQTVAGVDKVNFEVKIHLALVELLWLSGRYTEALTQLFSIEEQYLPQQTSGEKLTTIFSVNYFKGVVYRSQGNHDAALTALKINILYRELQADIDANAKTLMILGTVYGDKGNLWAALEVLKQSLFLYEVLENQESLSRVLNNIGTVYARLGDYKAALEFFQ